MQHRGTATPGGAHYEERAADRRQPQTAQLSRFADHAGKSASRNSSNSARVHLFVGASRIFDRLYRGDWGSTLPEVAHLEILCVVSPGRLVWAARLWFFYLAWFWRVARELRETRIDAERRGGHRICGEPSELRARGSTGDVQLRRYTRRKTSRRLQG